MKSIYPFLVLSLVFLSSCGGASLIYDSTVPTQSPPAISRVDPANGNAGDTVTIFGVGFSVVAGNNVISIAGTSAVASAYTLLANPTDGEVESLTVTIPANAVAGESSVFVTVIDNTSNSNLKFTLNP